MTDELTWDYTGDESSPLLQRSASPFYRWAWPFVTCPQAPHHSGNYALHRANQN